MKRTILACLVVAAMGSLSGYQDSTAQTGRELIAMERASMDGWLKGDAGPMLAASDPDITLFHVMTARRRNFGGQGAVCAVRRQAAVRRLPDRRPQGAGRR
jgi:hypothetical protein